MALINPSGANTGMYQPQRGGHELPVLVTLSDVVRACSAHDDVYLRFSYSPDDSDTSNRRERESGNLLPGVPAWPMCPEPWWGAGSRTWIARQLTRHSHLVHSGIEPWLIAGQVRGRGPDCEPLIAHLRPLALVSHKVLVEADESYAAWQTRAFRSLTG
ncbi:DUF6098 family protein [Georgenia satyanarayanai]|uniref:DUF6098 family protein n=1 Tax=Georgenia satyanarayanai TaxID=860221 RepID=UPI001263EC4D|nr:DUF6098 family protein [Georgenia satyanarayanai]